MKIEIFYLFLLLLIIKYELKYPKKTNKNLKLKHLI